MRHAYLITVYKEPTQLIDLVDSLDGPDSTFHIAVDAKSSLCGDARIGELSARANVRLSSDIRINWGGYSHLRALVRLLGAAVDEGRFDYAHALSGQCFPLTSARERDLLLESRGLKEHLTVFELPSQTWSGGGTDRYELYHLNDLLDPKGRWFGKVNPRFLGLQRKLGFKRKKPAFFPQVYGGGTWWSIEREAANYVIGFVRENPGALKRFRHTHCPEEIFFHSALMNSRFRDQVANDDLRYVDWEYRNGSCPAYLDEADFDRAAGSGKLFARKFDSTISAELRRLLKEHIKNDPQE